MQPDIRDSDYDPTLAVGSSVAEGHVTRNKTSGARVGGWLGVLIFVLMVLVPLSKLGVVADFNELSVTRHLIGRQHTVFTMSLWFVEGLLAFISIVAGYKLWKKHERFSVTFAVGALWLIWPIGNLVVLGIAAVTVGSESVGLDKVTSPTAALLLLAGAWTAYLIRSVRIKHVYRWN